jgi:alpha-glucosidase
MDHRRIFTVDPDYFPLKRVREIVSYLHAHGQKYGMPPSILPLQSRVTSVLVLMTDPAVAYTPNGGYGPYDRGHTLDLFLKTSNGTESLGVVWPGSRSCNERLSQLLT